MPLNQDGLDKVIERRKEGEYFFNDNTPIITEETLEKIEEHCQSQLLEKGNPLDTCNAIGATFNAMLNDKSHTKKLKVIGAIPTAALVIALDISKQGSEDGSPEVVVD